MSSISLFLNDVFKFSRLDTVVAYWFTELFKIALYLYNTFVQIVSNFSKMWKCCAAPWLYVLIFLDVLQKKRYFAFQSIDEHHFKSSDQLPRK